MTKIIRAMKELSKRPMRFTSTKDARDFFKKGNEELARYGLKTKFKISSIIGRGKETYVMFEMVKGKKLRVNKKIKKVL